MNQAPVNTVPGLQTTNEDMATAIPGIVGQRRGRRRRPGAGHLERGHGTLTLSGTTGLTFTRASTARPSLTFTGTLASLNAALTGLSYQSNLNFNGSDTLIHHQRTTRATPAAAAR